MFDVLFILLGLAGLVWSSDKFVEGAAAIANYAGMPPLLIGLTIVSLGTSAPEIVVSIMASIAGSGELAVGNALGSNIANTALVLGVTLIIKTIALDPQATRRELPQMVIATLLAGALMVDGELSAVDGIVLLSALALYLLLLSKRGAPDLPAATQSSATSPIKAWIRFLVGLALLVVSSRVLVEGAVNIATALGVSELIIGLTIVAIGTSLPELAASVMSALKGHSDIALGAILGSNIFNLLIVLPAPGLLGPLALDENVVNRDWLTTFLTAALLMTMVWMAGRRAQPDAVNSGELGRLAGVLLVSIYVIYMAILITAPDISW